MSEFDDEYFDSLETDFRQRAGALLEDTVRLLAPSEPQRVTVQQDIDGDGVIAAPGERVSWHLTGDVLRRDAGAGAQPVVEGVLDLSLRYLDRAGEVVSAPGAVRSIAVVLVVGPVVAGRAQARGSPTTLSTRIRLRNR